MEKHILCDICKEHIATVHYTEIVNNKLKKMNLCDNCAKAKNLGVTVQFSVADILKGLTEPPASGKKEKDKTCAFCGLTYSRFKKIGKLGCGECYEAFETSLKPVISDIHKNNQHTGKVPLKMKKVAKAVSQLDALHRQLRQAVEKEEYEQAAEIRDKIKKIEKSQETRERNSKK